MFAYVSIHYGSTPAEHHLTAFIWHLICCHWWKQDSNITASPLETFVPIANSLMTHFFVRFFGIYLQSYTCVHPKNKLVSFRHILYLTPNLQLWWKHNIFLSFLNTCLHILNACVLRCRDRIHIGCTEARQDIKHKSHMHCSCWFIVNLCPQNCIQVPKPFKNMK